MFMKKDLEFLLKHGNKDLTAIEYKINQATDDLAKMCQRITELKEIRDRLASIKETIEDEMEEDEKST